MDYIKQLNAFSRWLEVNHLPQLAQLIWYRLHELNNRAGWVEWLQVDNQRLMVLAGFESTRNKSFLTNRDKLIEVGLIEYEKGKKGYPNKYKMAILYGNSVPTTPQTTLQTTLQTTPIYKLNQTKTKKEKEIYIDKESKVESKKEKEKERKIKFAEFVSITEEEHQSLIAKVGSVGAKRCIEILDNYKGANGKTYKSDYRAILSWVIAKYQENNTFQKGNSSPQVKEKGRYILE